MAGAPIVLDAPWTGTPSFVPPTLLDITTLESAIVGQLQTVLSAALGTQMIEVRHFPDKPEAYEMRHHIGTALVIYSGSHYEKIEDIGHVAQERELHFNVGLRIRDLGWAFGGPPSGTSPGAYQIIELVQLALLGFQPNTGCRPMWAIRDHFVDRDKQGGVWVYEFEFATRTVVVENFSNPNWPLFIHGTAMEEGTPVGAAIAGNTLAAGTPVTALQVQAVQRPFSGNPGTINLGQQNISALIVKSTNLLTTYTLNSDYKLDNVNGIVTRIATGSIPANGIVTISYAYADVVTALFPGGSAPFAPNN